MKSVEVREQMANALTLDLIGPVSGLAAGAHLEREILPGVSIPSRWYLTGFLAPFESSLEDKCDEDSGEQMDLIPQATGIDDEAAPEASSTRKTPYPSSIGLSVLVPPDCRKITATVTWGDYQPVEGEKDAHNAAAGWQRTPKWAQVEIPLSGGTKAKYRLPDSDGLDIVPSIRPIPAQHFLTGGLQLVIYLKRTMLIMFSHGIYIHPLYDLYRTRIKHLYAVLSFNPCYLDEFRETSKPRNGYETSSFVR